MSSNSETGHAVNLANLLKLNQTVLTFGSTINPSLPALSTANVTALYTTASTKQTAVNSLKAVWQDATNVRATEFNKLKALMARIEGAIKSSGASKETLKDFKLLAKKILGQQSKKNKDDEKDNLKESKEITPGTTEPSQESSSKDESKGNSTSQLSMNQKINNFEAVIYILQNISTYNPNEPEVSIPGLQAFLIALKTENTNANNAWAALRKARGERNAVFYTEGTGLVSIGNMLKDYVLSVYGKTSYEYNSVKNIKFRNLS